jgi:DNA-binding NarL/FixJ family response regulator
VKRIDRVVELATQLAEKRDEVALLEKQLEALLGGGDEAEAPPKASNGTPPATNGLRERIAVKINRTQQIVDLVNAGLAAGAIAKKLGTSQGAVHSAVWFARKKGLFPPKKARAHQ